MESVMHRKNSCLRVKKYAWKKIHVRSSWLKKKKNVPDKTEQTRSTPVWLRILDWNSSRLEFRQPKQLENIYIYIENVYYQCFFLVEPRVSWALAQTNPFTHRVASAPQRTGCRRKEESNPRPRKRRERA
jgi:hypothetical protein